MIIARTDARSVLGLAAAVDRAALYAEAGADALFVEAPRDEDELATIGRELAGHPLVANMVEFGVTPLVPAERLGELGFAMVIYPGAVTRTVTQAALDVLGEIARHGTSRGHLDRMATFSEINEILGAC